MDAISDEQLARIREGIRLLALRRLGDRELADDVSQETIARGLEAIRDGRPADPDRLGAYFRGIALHVIADLYRDRGSARFVSHESPPGIEARTASPLVDAVRRERAGRVRQALDGLSDTDRELLRLSFYEGLTSAEIARRNGEPSARIRKRKQRALERLGRLLEEETGHIRSGRATENTTGPTSGATPEGSGDE